MVGWGTGSFENEEAQSWLRKLKGVSADDLRQILTAVGQAEYAGASEASIVIAAAEVVAAQRGAPLQPLPREIEEWLTQVPQAPEGLSELARNTVHRVRTNSELKDLWLEAEGLNEWSSSVRDLEQRLARSPS
jgi:uncharacterized protein DUF4259